MGFRNAPNIFQREMDHILSEFIDKCCVVYIDDILVFSKDVETHKKDLESIMTILEKYGLQVNEEKAEYFKESINFLGYTIEYNKINRTTIVRRE